MLYSFTHMARVGVKGLMLGRNVRITSVRNCNSMAPKFCEV